MELSSEYLKGMIRPYLWMIAAGLVLLVVILIGVMVHYINRAGVLDERLDNLRREAAELQKDIDHANAIGLDLEKRLADALQINQKLKEDLDEEISNNPVYSSCVVPASGVLLLNQALTRKPAR